jgi:hypothetical protein
MKVGSRHPIHMGINFVMSPPPVINPQSYLRFQEALVSCSVDFTNAIRVEERQENRIEVVRGGPTPLQIVVIASALQPIGQLLIIATPEPGRSLPYFVQEAEQVVEAFQITWPAPERQIVKKDVALRDLYETSSDHAFRELWEIRLRQSSDSLSAFGRPVLGGGLRFVMPPGESNPAQVEVRIESFLRDTSRVFVEVQFAWPGPGLAGQSLDPRGPLTEADDFITSEVHSFMGGE